MTDDVRAADADSRNPLERWTDAVRAELGIDAVLDRDTVLDLARDAARGVARPAAPLTAYLLGVAVGAGADPGQAAARVSALARTWRADPAAS